jgi:hypothetical protein
VEENSSEESTDVAKQLGVPSSTLNTITVKKKKIREHEYVSVDHELTTCGVLCGRNVW